MRACSNDELVSELNALPPDVPRVPLATGKLVGEGFDHPPLDARDLVRRARVHSKLGDDEAWPWLKTSSSGASQAVSRSAVIVDTNVVVAGLLTKQDASPVARILDGMPGAAFPFVLPEVAKADLVLVTGDRLLLRDAGMQGRMISPQAFVADG